MNIGEGYRCFNSYNTWGNAQTYSWDARKYSHVALTEHQFIRPAHCDPVASGVTHQRYFRTWVALGKPTFDRDRDSVMQFPLTFDEIGANGWWLKDDTGNVVEAANCCWVDPGKPGFADAYAEALIERTSRVAGVRGIVLDYLYPKVSDIEQLCGRSIPAYRDDVHWWWDAWEPFLRTLKTACDRAGYRLIGNCAGMVGQWEIQRKYFTGTIYENWCLLGDGSYMPVNRLRQNVTSLRTDPLEAWVSEYNCKESLPDYPQKALMSYALYLLGVPTESTRRRSYGHYGPVDSKPFWMPYWDIDLGEPGAWSMVDPVWSRQFSKGLVCINVGPTTRKRMVPAGYFNIVTGWEQRGWVMIPPMSAVVCAEVEK